MKKNKMIDIGFGVKIQKKPEAFVIDGQPKEEIRITNKGNRYRLVK